MSPAALRIGDETGPGRCFAKLRVAPVRKFGNREVYSNKHNSLLCSVSPSIKTTGRSARFELDRDI